MPIPVIESPQWTSVIRPDSAEFYNQTVLLACVQPLVNRTAFLKRIYEAGITKIKPVADKTSLAAITNATQGDIVLLLDSANDRAFIFTFTTSLLDDESYKGVWNVIKVPGVGAWVNTTRRGPGNLATLDLDGNINEPWANGEEAHLVLAATGFPTTTTGSFTFPAIQIMNNMSGRNVLAELNVETDPGAVSFELELKTVSSSGISRIQSGQTARTSGVISTTKSNWIVPCTLSNTNALPGDRIVATLTMTGGVNVSFRSLEVRVS